MSLDPEVTTVTVAPTATTVWSGDVRRHGLVTVQLQNLDATQTFSGSLLRKVSGALGWSTSTMGDLASISPAGTLDGAGNPLDSVTVDVDVEGTAEKLRHAMGASRRFDVEANGQQDWSDAQHRIAIEAAVKRSKQ